MHLGLIGGIGPAATVAYYLALVQGFKAAGIPLHLTIAHADVMLLSGNATAGRKEEQAQVFKLHLDQLAAAGCDVAVVTALTGHFCFAETVAVSPIPLLSAIDPVDRFCQAQGISVLGLLGSPPVLASHLFGLLQSPETVVPDGDPAAIGKTYMDLALSGTCTPEQRGALFDAGRDMIEGQGAQAVLLAGTDLGLAFAGQDPGYRVIDALALHVDAIVQHALAAVSD